MAVSSFDDTASDLNKESGIIDDNGLKGNQFIDYLFLLKNTLIPKKLLTAL